jgi:hypothetical protein
MQPPAGDGSLQWSAVTEEMGLAHNIVNRLRP